MTERFRLSMAQINPTVGDIAGNAARIRAARGEAIRQKADLLVCSEMVICGYPPEDLVYRNAFLDDVESAVQSLAEETGDGGPAVLLGAPWRVEGKRVNAALLLDDGRVRDIVVKHHLPNYGVFDEVRLFSPGPLPYPITCRGRKLGVMVCEDMWYPDVAAALAGDGAEVLVVINGSPFDMTKHAVRLRNARSRVEETGLTLVYVNQIGGQDELVFDGDGFVVHPDGRVVLQQPMWRETTTACPLELVDGRLLLAEPSSPPMDPLADRWEAIYEALLLGIRDYVNKNGFPGVVLGLSGGVDSALTAVLCADALGPDRVHCVMMPSPFTSRASLEDAEAVAGLLGCRLDSISIEPAMKAFDQMLAPVFQGREPDVAEENIQARARGVTLMALSNKLGGMVVSTGNKSELSVGYSTLYGDLCGGFAALKDVYKTTVYALCHWRNANRPRGAKAPAGTVIPERVITKAPTAELRPNQTDQDSLPPYEVLDAILKLIIEEQLGVREIVAQGHDAATVARVRRMLDAAEYKRRQAPPGVKITPLAFGRDRRYPITNAYHGGA